MSESLIFALVIGLTVYMFMRRLRAIKRDKQIRAEKIEQGEVPADPGSMPRIGSPGTITRDQINSLKEYDFEPSRIWSKEEAQLILDTVNYLRSVIYNSTQEKDPPIDVQNNILKFILTDEGLRDYVCQWGMNRTRDDETKTTTELPRDEYYQRVEAAVMEQWENA